MAEIEVRRPSVQLVHVPIVGLSPLIVHKFSQKAKAIMLAAAQGEKVPKEPKDPRADFEGAMHRLKDGRPGFPAIGFKAATVSAARVFGKNVKMTELRQCLFFHGEPSEDGADELVPIAGDFIMDERPVRVGRGSADLRYRPLFPEWSAVLSVSFLPQMLTRESVLSLIEAGGLTVGVGDWRPERNGDYGRYQIDPTRDVEVVEGTS